MAGTANTFGDYSDNADKKSRNIDLLSAWLFGRVHTGCLLIDISRCGGAVLIPRKHPIPSEAFELVVMSPENKNETLISLQAEQRWIDEDFSATHKKVGFKFQDTVLIEQQHIDTILNHLGSQKKASLECNLLNQ